MIHSTTKITAYGRTASIQEWSKDTLCRTDIETVVSRIAAGWQPELAISTEGSGLESEFIGVTWNKRRQRWQAQLRVGSKVKCLGYFTDEREAALQYNSAAYTLKGSDAKLNDI